LKHRRKCAEVVLGYLLRYWRNDGEETAGLHQKMSKDSDHTKVELAPGRETAGHNPPSSVEDPLVELARIVHRNKQPGGEPAGNRVETANYFDGLDDLAGTPDVPPARIEPQLQPVPPQPGPEPVPAMAPAPEVVTDVTPDQPFTPEFDVANDQVAPAPRRWDEPLAATPEPAPAVPREAVQSQLDQAVVQNLEENLSAELEDELIGAFKQSFAPAVEARTGPQIPPATEPAGIPDPQPTRPDFLAGPGAIEDDPRLDRIQVQPEPSVAPPPVVSRPEALEPNISETVAHGRTPISHEDLFSDLNALANEHASDAAKPEPQEPMGVEALFADLAFSPERDRDLTGGSAEPAPAIETVPEAESAKGESDDIDDMVWPDAVSAIPQADDEETPPPPGGYDLDAVAKAMQESDPTLDGTGVLPPHPKAERDAAPGAEKSSRKGLYAAGGVAAVALVGGLVFLFSDGSSVDVNSGPPPIIAGLQGPLKVYPESEQPPDDSSTSKLIYDRVGTQNGQAGERMVFPEKTTPAKLPPAPTDADTTDPLVPGASKKVRTVKVRPDGTIISGQPDTTPAPAPARAVETTPIRPTVTQPAEQPAPAPATQTATAPSVPVTPAVPQPQAPAPVQNGTPAIVSTVPVTAGQPDATSTPVPTISVVPRKKPAVPVQVARAPQAQAPAQTPAPTRTQTPPATGSGPLDLNNPGTATQPAAAQPTVPRATTPPASTGGRIAPGTYIVQVTSQRSEAAARNAYRGLQQKYPGILGNRQAVIVSANIQDRGTYYRARIPAGSRAEAISLCESLKGAGGDCFVRRN
jgi:hypothetical protein